MNNTFTRTASTRPPKGFSLLEVLLTVSILATLSSLAATFVTKFNARVKEQKLNSELATLNSAVSTYKAFGGDLATDTDPFQVIAKLKTVAPKEFTDRIPGLSGSMLDPRVQLVLQNDTEAKSGDPRIKWNATTGRFEMAYTGKIGIKKLILSEEALVDTRATNRQSLFLYSGTSNWVWDYGADTAPTYITPTTHTVSTPSSSSSGVIPSSTVVPPIVPPQSLQSPEFSEDPGAYSILEFPMLLELTNPNPEGSSQIQYSVDYAPWVVYSGSFTAPPGSVIQAQAVTSDYTKWSNSATASAAYEANPITLLPPSIEPSAEVFGALSDYEIIVTLMDNNPADYPTVTEFRINGGDWNNYTNDFILERANYENGALIEARTVSSSIYYEPSSITSVFIEYEELSISVNSTGEFTNPSGPGGMVTNLNYQTPSSSYFEWGSVFWYGQPVQGFSESTLTYSGGNGSGTTGQQIYLGNLDYYNGTIISGTGADFIDLNMDLSLNVGGTNLNLNFDFGFNLINVVNDSNANSPDPELALPSADFVQIASNTQTAFFEINGLDFSLSLEFGTATGDGFSSFDEFHVLEDRDADTGVYGTISHISE